MKDHPLNPRTPPKQPLGRLVNATLLALLRSPFHRLASGSLMTLSFSRRKTGGQATIPVMYARDGDSLLVAAAHPERKQWWRNLRSPQQVEMCIDGRTRTGVAVLLTDPRELELGLATYLRRFPRSAGPLGLSAAGEAKPNQAGRQSKPPILVRITLK